MGRAQPRGVHCALLVALTIESDSESGGFTAVPGKPQGAVLSHWATEDNGQQQQRTKAPLALFQGEAHSSQKSALGKVNWLQPTGLGTAVHQPITQLLIYSHKVR